MYVYSAATVHMMCTGIYGRNAARTWPKPAASFRMNGKKGLLEGRKRERKGIKAYFAKGWLKTKKVVKT